ncbi:MAG: DmsC/YnfH family molybdoenzyme membrane anchor subunit [Melioribacteraceae bacterium]|nr:DmsC/YnfH family molybdoenzyme membrane anchor subunit [Melioribacteraceae bacterium]
MKSQWSLIIFTLLVQLAVGSTLVLSFINSQFFSKIADSLTHEITVRSLIIIVTSLFVAVISSFFHLGSPLNAHFSLNNLSSSWLSREILLIILFSTSILTYFLFEIMFPSNQHVRLTIAIISSILGIALLFSMSKLYMIETVPAWNTFLTPAKIILTTIILGTTSLLLILITGDYSNTNIVGDNLLFKSILHIVLIILFAELILFIVEIWTLKSGVLAELGSFKLITEDNSFTCYLHLFLFASSILLILYNLLIPGNKYSAPALLIISILVVLLQITQRYLFYASYNRIGI